MKKISTIFMLASLLTPVICHANVGHIYNVIQTLPLEGQNPFANQQQGVDKIDIETPFRCQTDSALTHSISTTLPVSKSDFTLKKTTSSDPLPSFEVNGYDFENKPLDEAIQYLVDEAKILVYTQDNTYPSLSAKGIYGDLESVVEALTKNAGTYYSYNEGTQKLYITRHADFEIKLPKNRLIILAVLDALRGTGIENIIPDWSQGILRLTLTADEEKKAEKLLQEIKTNGQLVVAETKTYRLNPGVDWNYIMSNYGLSNIHSSNSSLNGKLLVLGQSSNGLINILNKSAGAKLVSNGIAVVPNGWKTIFDISKCGQAGSFSYPLHLNITPTLGSHSVVSSEISLNTQQGELSSFDVTASLNDELAIVGINDHSGSSMLLLVKLKLIRLTGEN